MALVLALRFPHPGNLQCWANQDSWSALRRQSPDDSQVHLVPKAVALPSTPRQLLASSLMRSSHARWSPAPGHPVGSWGRRIQTRDCRFPGAPYCLCTMVEGSRTPSALCCCRWVGKPHGYTVPGAVRPSSAPLPGRGLARWRACRHSSFVGRGDERSHVGLFASKQQHKRSATR